MENPIYHIYTLHRERFIILVLLGVFLSAFVAAQFQVSEVYKIVIILFCLPILLFLSITWSKKPSIWQITAQELIIKFSTKRIAFAIADIAKIQISTRSGGSLITIHTKDKSGPKRYWSNKLFQKQDDIKELIQAFEDHSIPVLMQ